MQSSKQRDNTDENSVQPTDPDSSTHSIRTSLASSLSGETVIETDHRFLSCQAEQDSCSTQSDTSTAEPKPVAKVTYDVICPQIVESIHQALFCCQCTHSPKTNTLPLISSETESTDRSCPGSYKPHKQTSISEPDEDSHTGHVACSGENRQAGRSLPVLASNGSYTHYCITVTGWEGGDTCSCSLNAADSSQTSAVPPAQTREESFNEGKSRYLNPPMHQGLGHFPNNLQQVNSFEMEEVQ